MALPFTDTFTDTNGTDLPVHDSTWQAISGFNNLEIQSNACVGTAGESANSVGETFSNDQYVQIVTGSTGITGDYPGLIVRLTDSNNYYYVAYNNNDQLYLSKNVAGSDTTLDTASAPAAGSVLRLECEGTALRVYDDDVLIASATDSSHSAGVTGIYMFGTQTSLDDFETGNLGGGGTEYTQGAAGTLTTAGTLTGQGRKVLAGTLTSAGALIKQAAISAAGALTSAGTVAKQAQPAALAGALTSAGTLTGQGQKALAGALTSAGVLIGQGQKVLGGALTSAGAIARQAGKPLAGTLTTAGALSAVKTALLSLAGTLTSAGTLTTQGQKVLGGTLSSAGALVRKTAVSMAGAVTTAGVVAKRAVISLAGVLSSAGAVATSFLEAGAITPLVNLTTQVRDFSLTTKSRLFALAAQIRDFTLTAKDRDN